MDFSGSENGANRHGNARHNLPPLIITPRVCVVASGRVRENFSLSMFENSNGKVSFPFLFPSKS